MANAIILKSRSTREVGNMLAFSFGLALSVDGVEVEAKFYLTSANSTLPMIGITEYGKLVGMSSISEVITIKAVYVKDHTEYAEINVSIQSIVLTADGSQINEVS